MDPESISNTIYNSANQFSTDKEIEHDTKTNKPPQAILDLDPPVHERAILSNDEMREIYSRAWNNKWCKLKFPYQRTMRTDPTLNGQRFAVISFIPSKNAIPDKEGCYGVLKVRGNFGTEFEAERWSQYLMRRFDSYSEYKMCLVGQEVPLMDNDDIYTKETAEIDAKAKIDDISMSFIKKKKQEEREQREEVEDRARRLMERTDASKAAADEQQYDSDLEHYTMQRVKKANALNMIEECKKKMKEAHGVLQDVSVIIEKLDAKFPAFKTQFEAEYRKAIQQINGKPEENPLIAYMSPEKQDQPVQPLSFDAE